MSKRTTAEIEADLRAPRAYGWAAASLLRKEAADRLRELDDDKPDPWPITAIDNRDLLDELANDDDVPVYRRNEARQAVKDFDAALSGVDAL